VIAVPAEPGRTLVREMSKRCRGCGEEKPLDQFRRDRHSGDGRRDTCKHCQAARGRGELPPSQAVTPPDPRPAWALRTALNGYRAQGLDFATAWPLAVNRALAVAGKDRGGWWPVFAWSRDAWRGAYERQEPRRGERVL
jgi:hypothetical protein